ncbi:hypothetical protein [Haloquadratum walsbyi]|jgi:hypothetical protein|uniref:DUF7991 domain-containing protein n=1 Tax=Haloquadratum walsbyi J07HQW2 TaxID=1238425 RepID=U1PSU8_9EURY|nr:hypothetical protein [Haloquadratum walsbyi]ERG95436.1 MAG: hypothetical protein J07HQW2_01893 [Haloquadratum walsbyi J07HQW2]
MASAVGIVLFVAVLIIHTLVAAVITRFFRIRLKTQLGYVMYSFLLVPFALLILTLLFTGIFGIGVNLGDPTTATGVMIGLPFALGFTIDTLYVPAPEEYDLPETQ